MNIVDSQLHVWLADSPQRPWPAGRAADAHRPYPVPAESMLLQMDLAGVRRAVIVPPSWEGDRNDAALDAAARYPDRFAVMGRLALDAADGAQRIAAWRAQPGMLGLRFTFHLPQHRRHLDDGRCDWIWTAAEAAGVPVMVLVAGAFERFGDIAERHPGLRLVLDHAGLDHRARAPEVFEALPSVCALASHPNVAVKVSGMPSLSAQAHPFADLHEPIRRLFDAFGPERTFWGTDLTRMPCSYHECIALFTEHLPWLGGEDLERVMGRALCKWLDWPLPVRDGSASG